MTELYSIPDVAKLFALQESRLRYWMQTGFVGPTVRKQNRFYYTFRDLCAVKAAKDLLAAGLSAQKVRMKSSTCCWRGDRFMRCSRASTAAWRWRSS